MLKHDFRIQATSKDDISNAIHHLSLFNERTCLNNIIRNKKYDQTDTSKSNFPH